MAEIVRGLPFEEYAARDAVNFSTLKEIEVSPRHYQRARDHARKDSSALRIGRCLHALLLDPSPPGVAIYEGKVRHGKVWDAFEAAHPREIILRRDELDTVEAMRAAVLRHPVASALIAEGEGEVTIEWSMLGHPCRGRVDWLRPCGGLVEVKTTRRIEKRLFARDFAARYYHAQTAFYSGAIEAVGCYVAPSLPRVIAIENEAPYDVAVYRLGFDTVEAGARKIDEWMRRYDECARAGVWPGVCGDEEVEFRLPDWALATSDIDLDLSGIEEEHHV